jgi:hypothetical protein
MKTGAPYTAWLSGKPIHKACIARVIFYNGTIAHAVQANGGVVARHFLWASEWDEEEAWSKASSKFDVPTTHIHKGYGNITVWKYPIIPDDTPVLDAIRALTSSPHGKVMVERLMNVDGYSSYYGQGELLKAGFVISRQDVSTNLSVLTRDPGRARGILSRRMKKKLGRALSVKKARELRKKRAVASGSLDVKVVNSLVKILLRGRNGRPSTMTAGYTGSLVSSKTAAVRSAIDTRCEILMKAVNFAKSVTGLLPSLRNDKAYRELIKEAILYVPGMMAMVKKRTDSGGIQQHISHNFYVKKAVVFLRGEAKRCRISLEKGQK